MEQLSHYNRSPFAVVILQYTILMFSPRAIPLGSSHRATQMLFIFTKLTVSTKTQSSIHNVRSSKDSKFPYCHVIAIGY